MKSFLNIWKIIKKSSEIEMANLNFKALQRQKSFMFLNKMDSYCKYMEILSKYPTILNSLERKKTAIFPVNL